jgi:hypothetical protein
MPGMKLRDVHRAMMLLCDHDDHSVDLYMAHWQHATEMLAKAQCNTLDDKHRQAILIDALTNNRNAFELVIVDAAKKWVCI